MLNRYLAGLIPVATVVLSIVAAAVQPTPGDLGSAASQQESQPAVDAAAEQLYIGSDRCVTCHRTQTSVWAETPHALAYEHLPEQYRKDPSCLKCHLTGFAEPGGYVLGMPEDEAKPYLSVGCESCHGPGAAHEDLVKQWTLSDPADEERLLVEMKEAITLNPPDSVCATCHTRQGHQGHPPYDGQPLPQPAFHSNQKTTASSVALPPSPHSYSVKTCGSCHYVQYKQWSVGSHVDLSARLSTRYESDQSCLECHRPNLRPWDWYNPPEDTQVDVSQVGVGCESCHGAAHKHVLFNKQNILGPKLTPEMEEAARQTIREGQPVARCVQCHTRDGHKAHPEFEQPGDASSN